MLTRSLHGNGVASLCNSMMLQRCHISCWFILHCCYRIVRRAHCTQDSQDTGRKQLLSFHVASCHGSPECNRRAGCKLKAKGDVPSVNKITCNRELQCLFFWGGLSAPETLCYVAGCDLKLTCCKEGAPNPHACCHLQNQAEVQHYRSGRSCVGNLAGVQEPYAGNGFCLHVPNGTSYHRQGTYGHG